MILWGQTLLSKARWRKRQGEVNNILLLDVDGPNFLFQISESQFVPRHPFPPSLCIFFSLHRCWRLPRRWSVWIQKSGMVAGGPRGGRKRSGSLPIDVVVDLAAAEDRIHRWVGERGFWWRRRRDLAVECRSSDRSDGYGRNRSGRHPRHLCSQVDWNPLLIIFYGILVLGF